MLTWHCARRPIRRQPYQCPSLSRPLPVFPFSMQNGTRPPWTTFIPSRDVTHMQHSLSQEQSDTCKVQICTITFTVMCQDWDRCLLRTYLPMPPSNRMQIISDNNLIKDVIICCCLCGVKRNYWWETVESTLPLILTVLDNINAYFLPVWGRALRKWLPRPNSIQCYRILTAVLGVSYEPVYMNMGQTEFSQYMHFMRAETFSFLLFFFFSFFFSGVFEFCPAVNDT